jgi:hypothetical protein
MNYLFIAKMITNELTKILSLQKHREFINQLRLVDAEFLSKQSNAIKQDLFHINDERSLINQLQ